MGGATVCARAVSASEQRTRTRHAQAAERRAAGILTIVGTGALEFGTAASLTEEGGGTTYLSRNGKMERTKQRVRGARARGKPEVLDFGCILSGIFTSAGRLSFTLRQQ